MTRNPVQRLFDWKVRGIRWIEIIGMACVAALIFSVYVAKAGAARESSRITELEREIADSSQRVRLLRAEAARLESPTRLEALSRAAGLGPVEVDRQAAEASLPELNSGKAPAAPAPAAPAPAAPSAAAPAPEAEAVQ